MNQIKMNLRIILFAVMAVIFTSCSSAIRFTSSQNENAVSSTPGTIISGKASYYGLEFDGRKTSNGEIFDMNKFTAAHRSLKFGTVLKVTNVKNNKSVVVRINDRGPFNYERILDLSQGAAEKIGMIKDGVADVEIEILE
jgi:rare lipoprotein A